jgi:hypothetical protein
MNTRPASTYTTPAQLNKLLPKAITDDESASMATEYSGYYAYILDDCFAYSKIIEDKTQRTFVPYAAEKVYYFRDLVAAGDWYIADGRYVLRLDEDLLAVDSIDLNGTDMDTDTYYLADMNARPNAYPYRSIVFDSDEVPTWDTGFSTCITITGEWGVQDNSSDAYETVGVLAAAVNSTTTTTLSVADASLYSVYDYIRVDDELMLVTALTTTGPAPESLTVKRGVNGFTAATHENAASITRWCVVSDVRKLATKMVAYAYQRRSDAGERAQWINDSLVIAEFDKELSQIAERRRYGRIAEAI